MVPPASVTLLLLAGARRRVAPPFGHYGECMRIRRTTNKHCHQRQHRASYTLPRRGATASSDQKSPTQPGEEVFVGKSRSIRTKASGEPSARRSSAFSRGCPGPARDADDAPCRRSSASVSPSASSLDTVKVGLDDEKIIRNFTYCDDTVVRIVWRTDATVATAITPRNVSTVSSDSLVDKIGVKWPGQFTRKWHLRQIHYRDTLRVE